MAGVLSFARGINVRLKPYELPEGYCVSMQNLRHTDEIMESIPGTIKWHSTSLGSDPITAIMPYYNTNTGDDKVLIASGTSIYYRNDATGSMTTLKTGLTANSIYSSDDRLSVKYIASENDNLMKYEGGQKIYSVGGGSTQPGAFRQVLYMKETDRLFGIRTKENKNAIVWSDYGQPEIWDGANIDAIKSTDGDDVEWAEILLGRLVIFKTYSIWIYLVDGLEENWRLEQAPTTVGCRAFKTVKKVGNEIWFLGDNAKGEIGVYAFNGATCRLLTDDVSPILKRINPHRIQESVAEVHEGLYTISFPMDASITNSHSLDLDILNVNENGSPAIYGLHTLSFYSSAVLNSIQRSGEFLMGSQTSGFVLREGGTSFNTVSGTGGNLIENKFLGPVHIDGGINTVKKYNAVNIFFEPRGFVPIDLRVYLSHRSYNETLSHIQQASRTFGYPIYTDVYVNRLLGSPDLHFHQEILGVLYFGTSVQFEFVNDTVDKRLAIQGYTYDFSEEYEGTKVQMPV